MPPLTLGDLQEIHGLTGRDYISAMIEVDPNCFQLWTLVNPDKASGLRAHLPKLGFVEEVKSPTHSRWTKIEHYPDRDLLISFEVTEFS